MRDIPGLKADFFKALGHPVRIRALELLSERERTVSELLAEMDVEQPNLSQQLAVLRRGGFVETRRDGTNVVYALADPRIAELLATARQILVDLIEAAQQGLARS